MGLGDHNPPPSSTPSRSSFNTVNGPETNSGRSHHASAAWQRVPAHNNKRPYTESTTIHKSAVMNAANQRTGYTQAPSRFPTGTSTLASQLGQSNITYQPNYYSGLYNPSMGPASSAMSESSKRQRTPSGYTSNNARRINTGVCKMSGRTRMPYKLGHIISLPSHTANTNPNIDPVDRRLVQTVEGPAYSKRRMFVVMWIHEQDMFCLPLYTFNGTGLQKKHHDVRHEYVSMKNFDDKNFFNQGMYPAVMADCKRPLHPDTTVHVAGGQKVACNEDIYFAGRMIEKSFYDLLRLWQDLTDDAQREVWRD